MNLKSKTVLITGAGRGLGKTLALRFGEEGANVVVVSRTLEEIKKVADRINSNGGQALAVQADVSIEEDVKRLFAKAVERFGRIDILVNNAAVHKSLTVLETDLNTWKKIIDVNLTGSFLCAKEAARLMIKNRSGRIINISSSAANHYFPGFAAYTASKAGLNGFTMVLAEEVKKFNINVVSLNLGLVDTEYTRSRINDADSSDWLKPDEVADVVLFLSTPESDAINGTTIDIFGKRK